MPEKMYKFVCYEKVEGDGPICWYGEQEYIFPENEAKAFMNERFDSLGEKTNDNLLTDQTGRHRQHLVTYSIKCEPYTDEEMPAVSPGSDIDIPF